MVSGRLHTVNQLAGKWLGEINSPVRNNAATQTSRMQQAWAEEVKAQRDIAFTERVIFKMATMIDIIMHIFLPARHTLHLLCGTVKRGSSICCYHIYVVGCPGERCAIHPSLLGCSGCCFSELDLPQCKLAWVVEPNYACKTTDQ